MHREQGAGSEGMVDDNPFSDAVLRADPLPIDERLRDEA